MLILSIVPNVDEAPGPFPWTAETITVRAAESPLPVGIVGIPNGTASGATIVAIMTALPDGKWAMTEIKAEMLLPAVKGIIERCKGQ